MGLGRYLCACKSWKNVCFRHLNQTRNTFPPQTHSFFTHHPKIYKSKEHVRVRQRRAGLPTIVSELVVVVSQWQCHGFLSYCPACPHTYEAMICNCIACFFPTPAPMRVAVRLSRHPSEKKCSQHKVTAQKRKASGRGRREGGEETGKAEGCQEKEQAKLERSREQKAGE